MSNKTYLCTLKPISKFFFGGERTFGQDGGTKTNYLVRSNAFPQQTTLLGMLRFELLKQNNLVPITRANEVDVGKTIGKQSFKISELSPDYGFIQNISPLFICKGDEKLSLAPRDVVRYMDKKDQLIDNEQWAFSADSQNKAFLFGSDKEVVLSVIDKFNHKHDYQPHFLHSDGTSVPFDYDSDTKEGVFISESQIGIKKNENAKDAKGFYKQFYYRMNKEYVFGFYTETSTSIVEQTSIVYMGADKSAFMLTIQDADGKSFDSDFGIDTYKNGTKVTLLSDTYVAEDIYQYCAFALVETLPFRNIETDVGTTTDYRNLHKNKLTKCLNLLARGSALYPSDLVEVKRILNNENFQKIGYNVYKID